MEWNDSLETLFSGLPVALEGTALMFQRLPALLALVSTAVMPLRPGMADSDQVEAMFFPISEQMRFASGPAPTPGWS